MSGASSDAVSASGSVVSGASSDAVSASGVVSASGASFGESVFIGLDGSVAEIPVSSSTFLKIFVSTSASLIFEPSKIWRINSTINGAGTNSCILMPVLFSYFSISAFIVFLALKSLDLVVFSDTPIISEISLIENSS